MLKAIFAYFTGIYLAVLGVHSGPAPIQPQANPSQVAQVASTSQIQASTTVPTDAKPPIVTKSKPVAVPQEITTATPVVSKPKTCSSPSGAVINCDTGEIISGPSQEWQNQVNNAQALQPVTQPIKPQAQTNQTQATPQPQQIEQVWMNKFLVEVSNGVNLTTSNYNQNCYNNGQGSANQACIGLSGVENATLVLQNYAIAAKSPYRSGSCDQQLYNILEQILQADLSESNRLAGMLHQASLATEYSAQILNIINGTNALITPLATQAQTIIASCQ